MGPPGVVSRLRTSQTPPPATRGASAHNSGQGAAVDRFPPYGCYVLRQTPACLGQPPPAACPGARTQRRLKFERAREQLESERTTEPRRPACSYLPSDYAITPFGWIAVAWPNASYLSYSILGGSSLRCIACAVPSASWRIDRAVELKCRAPSPRLLLMRIGRAVGHPINLTSDLRLGFTCHPRIAGFVITTPDEVTMAVAPQTILPPTKHI